MSSDELGDNDPDDVTTPGSDSSRRSENENYTSEIDTTAENSEIGLSTPDFDSEDVLDSNLDLDEAEDPETLAETIVQEIADGTYVCLVCTGEIDRHSEVWTCHTCYRVYDLECIADWATRGSSTAQNGWRCPACSVKHKKIPSKFTCWCGRVNNPLPDSLVPFSCGNPCNAPYAHCVHQCSTGCHPGKHPECGAMGPAMNCRCGKHTQQLPCLVTPYSGGWTCGTPCGTVVCELGHKCKEGCHLGFCGPCKQMVDVRCYCGETHQQVACLAAEPKQCREKNDRSAVFVGAASCGAFITEYYACGVHYDELPCLPLPGKQRTCKYDPKTVTHCYCGKTPATAERELCTDPMPECDLVCGKPLPCGCTCEAKCHSGPCECFRVVDAKCRCGSTTYLVPCKALQQGFQPQCLHKCGAMLSCRKHYHRAVCCEFEQQALVRERYMRKQVRNNIRTLFSDVVATMEPVHICTRTCNQVLRCGVHRCSALCHSGPCGVCLESSNDDLVCHCGKTVVPAPVRCGTTIVCQEPCIRPKTCGHPPEQHRCHDDARECPKCTYLVTRRCNCGEREVAGVLCSMATVSCGKICTARIECGHICNRACSRECVEGHHNSASSCHLVCKRIRPSCPHMCTERCHYSAGTPCDAKKCTETVVVTCGCGRLSRSVACGALASAPSLIGTVIGCDDECNRIKREAELHSIFTGTAQNDADLAMYSSVVTSVFRRQVKWCTKMEAIVRRFVGESATEGAKQSLHFPAMPAPQREFLHNLALAFKVYLESQDREPHRSVFYCVTKASVVPLLTIQQFLDQQEEIERKKLEVAELEKHIDTALFNAILVQDVFFGVSPETVQAKIAEIMEKHPDLTDWRIVRVKDSSYVFFDTHFASMDAEKENQLYMLLKTFKKTLRDELVAFDCKMCVVNADVDVVLKTDLSRVVAPIEEKLEKKENLYSVLGQQDVEA